MLFINHPHKYQCAHTTTHRGQGECTTVWPLWGVKIKISDRTVSSSILQCEDWRPNSTKFYRLNTTYTHICTRVSKHCLHIHIYECIMLNLLLFGILVWKYAECIPGNDTTHHINSAHLLFLMHLLHLMATAFQDARKLSVFQHISLLHRLPPPWLLIHPVQRGIYHTMVWLSHFQVSNQIPVHHTLMTETKKADICHKDRWRGCFTLCISVWENRKHYSFSRKEDVKIAKDFTTAK